jgi:hypothetical protein
MSGGLSDGDGASKLAATVEKAKDCSRKFSADLATWLLKKAPNALGDRGSSASSITITYG